jgi:hypothetical protein
LAAAAGSNGSTPLVRGMSEHRPDVIRRADVGRNVPDVRIIHRWGAQAALGTATANPRVRVRCRRTGR